MSYVHNRLSVTFRILCVLILLQSCSSMKSTAISKGESDGAVFLSVLDEIPQRVPGNTVPVPHSQYLLALTGNAATMLIPIPFAGDVLQSSINNSVAEDYSEIYKNYYASIDVYSLALKEFKHHPEFSVTANARIRLYPYVVVQECEDKKYRLSLIMQIEKENWLGRYLYHLPTAYPVEDAKKPTQQELTTFTSELHTGVVKLVGLIQRDRQGSLKSTGNKVTFGSYHIVGYNLVAPANILKIKNADLIEEVNGKVIIRSDGDPTAAVGNYGLGFGVHYFDRQQLHTFDKQ